MFFILAFFISTSALAQWSDPALVGNIVDVVTHADEQAPPPSASYVEETLKLENQVMTPATNGGCLEEIPQNMVCDSLKDSLLAEDRKQSGWRVLFEARYIPIGQAGVGRSVGSAGQYFDYYTGLIQGRFAANQNLKTPTSASELDQSAKEFASYYGLKPEDMKGPLLLYSLQQTKNYSDMMAKFKTLSNGMSDQEYLQFLSSVAGWADYNDARAKFEQKEGAGLGVVGPFEQIIGTKSGVCGDIHSMVAKFAEQRGWEAFTVGYALSGDQHVVTSVVDPKNPNKLMVVNYGHYEEQALNDGNSVKPTPSQTMPEVGMQLRIFKNDAKNGGDGGMQQIATIPTPLGSFMNSLFQKEGQIQGAMAENENYQFQKGGMEHTSHRTYEMKNGSLRERIASQGMLIYEGTVDNAQVYGIAVSHDVFNKLYGYDPKQKKCVQRKSKYFAVGLAASLVNLPQDQTLNNYYVYLNVKGGQIISLYETPHFQFKGLLGYELEALATWQKNGAFSTGDGNLATYAGVLAEYQKNGWAISGGMKVETNVGLKNQNLMTDLSALPGNVAPFSFNALKTDFSVHKQLNSGMTFVSDNSFIMSRVGNRIVLSTGIIKQNTSVMLSYQQGLKSFPLGNSLQNISLLQNLNQSDGVKLTVGQKFASSSGKFSGTVSVWGGLATTMAKPQGYGGIQVKIKLGK